MRPSCIPPLVLTLIASGGCAYYQPGEEARQRTAAEQAFAQGPDPADAMSDERQSQAAAQRNDWKLSADFAERSYKQKPDLVNEFNLATAYQRTGRGDLAVPLYIDLMERGQYTATVPLIKFDGTWPTQPMAPTIADEAENRLRRMGVNAGLRTRSAQP